MTVLDVNEKPTRPPLKKLKKYTTKAPVTSKPKSTPLVTSNIGPITKTKTTPLPTRNSTSLTTFANVTSMNQTLSEQKPKRPPQKKLKTFTTKAPVTSPSETTLLTKSNIAPITKNKTTSLPIRKSPSSSSKAKTMKKTLYSQTPQWPERNNTLKAKTMVRDPTPNLKVLLKKVSLLSKKKKVPAKRPKKRPSKRKVVEKKKITKIVEKGIMKPVNVKTNKAQAKSKKAKKNGILMKVNLN